jgi:prepilin-type N-terminal cleavage/methylation domain-containing protein
MKNLTQRGFTLIELLVVIAIIGILAGILFLAIDPSGKIDDANVAKVKASLQGVPTAATLHYTGNGYEYTTFCTGNLDSTAVAGLSGYDCDADADE